MAWVKATHKAQKGYQFSATFMVSEPINLYHGVMIPPPQTPSYVPASHLVASSLLTAPQLVAQYQDFCNNLQHVSTAPGLVFERLAANLSEATNAAFELERANHSTAVRNYQSSILELEDQVRELKRELSSGGGSKIYDDSSLHTTNPSSANAVVKYRRNPIIGQFDTNELRSWREVRLKTSKVITFANPYDVPPALLTGLTTVDIGNNKNVRVKSSTSGINKTRFEIHLDTWEDTTLYSAACNWLEIPADSLDIQFGSYDTLEDRPWYQPQAHHKRKIRFQRPYSSLPIVVVWLSTFDMSRDKVWRIKTFATDVTKSGFTINIVTWEDSIVYSAVTSWVAYPTDMEDISSGQFSTDALRTWRNPQLHNSAYETFKTQFRAPPNVFLAINYIDISNRANLRLIAKTSSITAAGMTWHLDSWQDTTLYAAGACYIALGSTPIPHKIQSLPDSSPPTASICTTPWFLVRGSSAERIHP